MAKDTSSSKKVARQARTVRTKQSVAGPHSHPVATGSSNVIASDGKIDNTGVTSIDYPYARVLAGLGPNTSLYYQQRMATLARRTPHANQRYTPYPMPPARPTHGQAPSSAPFYSYSSSMPAANPTTSRYLRRPPLPTTDLSLDSAETSPASFSGKGDNSPLSPAPVRRSSATTPIHSSLASSEPANNKKLTHVRPRLIRESS